MGSRQANDAAPRTDLPPLLDAHRAALQSHFPIPPARPSKRRRMAKHAGGALALLAAAGLTWWADPSYRTEQYDTRIGQRTELKLADGSLVTLDTDTHLSVQWRLRSRHVELHQGRAQFDVSPALLRPFTIAAGTARIHVVGTRFDVWRQRHGTEVSVYQGQVRIWREGQPDDTAALVQAGLKLSVDARAAIAPIGRPMPFDTALGNAWRQGRFVFRDTPLQQAVQQIQRYHPAPIRLQDPQLDELQISGVFDSDNIQQLLTLLPRILPVSVERRPDGSMRIDAAAERSR